MESTVKTPVEVTDSDIEMIATQIKEGCTSGHLSDGEGNRIYWEITINKWAN